MGNLLKFEAIAAPNLRRAEKMPSLPGWLTSCVTALATNLQIGSNGTFQEVLTLPTERLLGAAARAATQAHIDSLRSSLLLTPEIEPKAEAMVLGAVTKLIQALPGQRSSETQVEAKGEAYMAALDDVPYWAIDAAIRKWYRGDCGHDERGKPYDYNWTPAPAALRRISLAETGPYHERIRDLQRLLGAVPYIDCAAELARGQAAVRGLLKAITTRADIASMTFEDVVNLGEIEPFRFP